MYSVNHDLMAKLGLQLGAFTGRPLLSRAELVASARVWR